MACIPVRTPDGRVMIVCTRGPSKERRCIVCRRPESRCEMRLCDYPERNGPKTKLCSQPICSFHALHVEPDLDYCPRHAQLVQAESTP